MIIEAIKTTLKELKLNKLRTFLTMLGIIIGIFSITIIFSLSTGTKNYMNNTISSINKEVVEYTVLSTNNIETEFIEKDLTDYATQNTKVNKISKSTIFYNEEYDQILKSQNIETEYLYQAIDENYFDLNIPEFKEEYLLYGKILSKKDIVNKMPYIMLRENVAKNILGKTNVVGQKININNNEFEIIGIYKNSVDDLGYAILDYMYISYYYAKSYMKISTSRTYYFSPNNSTYTPKIRNEVKEILSEYLPSDYFHSYSVDLDSIMTEFEDIISIVELVFISIASLSLIVGGIGIMNIMLVSVSERIKETGIRMALGARNIDIIVTFLIEGIILTIFSGLIGIILALLTSKGVNVALQNYTSYDFILTINIITTIKIILFCGLIGIIFSLYPAIKAGKLDPVDALKYE